MTESPEPKDKDLLGHYRLVEKIAQGGMAEVYRAETFDPNGLKREVVIKRILPHIASHREFIDMLIDEAKIAVQFNHGNIAQVYDLGKVGNDYFIVMEHVPGYTLQQVLKQATTRNSRLPISCVLYVVSELCAGLAYMHHKEGPDGKPLGVVHRDISPQNIILSPSGLVKLIDFGVAKAADKITITESGVLKGKFAYMSPEQAMGDPLDSRSDVFSAGIILWEMLSGERLFRKKNNTETLKAVKKANIPSLSSYRKDLPKGLLRAVEKVLARNRRRRYGSAANLQTDLLHLLYANFPTFKPAELVEYVKGLFAEPLPGAPSVSSPLAGKDEEVTKREKIRLSKWQEGEDTDKRRLAAHEAADEKTVRETVDSGENTMWIRPEDLDTKPVIAALSEEDEEIEKTTIHVEESDKEGSGSPGEGGEPFLSAPPLSPRSRGGEMHSETALPPLPESLVPDASCEGEGRGGKEREERKKPHKKVLIILFGAILIGVGVLVGVLLKGTSHGPASYPESGKESQQPLSEKKLGFLVVESDPAGADIFLDDQNTGKRTPSILEGLVPNRPYRVGVTLKGRNYREESLSLQEGETRTLRLHLGALESFFSFVSDPAGAYVSLNGKAIGRTPILNYAISPDTVSVLKITHPGFREEVRRFEVVGGERKRLFFRLEPVTQ